MAANPKTLRVVAARSLGPDTRALTIEIVGGPPFEAFGGKYVIVQTGATAGDKAVKRAYSLLPIEGDSGRAQLTVKRVGPGSAALHAAAVGTELSFSGPWGKLVPEGGLDARTLVVATDTGITAALGVVEERAHGRVELDLLWLRARDETFLGVDDVRTRAERSGARFVDATIPSVTSRDRETAAWARVDAIVLERRPSLVVAAGDGAVIHPLRDRLAAEPFGVRDVRVECFFRNPEKKIT